MSGIDIYKAFEDNVATKQDIASLREDILQMRLEFKDEAWKLKLYLILLAVLIVITNPTVLELFGKLVGVIK